MKYLNSTMRTTEPPKSSPAAPSVSKSVLKALKRIDRNLHVQFSPFYVNKANGSPLVKENGELIPYPRFHIWAKERGTGRYYYVLCVEDENGEFAPVDERVIWRLERDVFRHYTPAQLIAKIESIEEQKKQKANQKVKELRREFVSANRKQFEEAMERPFQKRANITREERIFSYPGQANRSINRDLIREDGGYVDPGFEELEKE